MVLIKKRTFFVQNVSVDTWIAFCLSCQKVATKPSYKICSRSEFEKKSTISQKQCFFKNHTPPTSGQLNCGFEHLTKPFLSIFRNKLLHRPEKTWFFQNGFSCIENFTLETLEVFSKKSGRKIFARVSKKVL